MQYFVVLMNVIIAIFLAATGVAVHQIEHNLHAKSVAHRTGAAQFVEIYDDVDNSNEQSSVNQQEDVDYEVYQGVVGRPGIDFPIWFKIPQTGFSCRAFGNGYFADLETDCQVFHICEEGRKISFLCPNGTIFQQSELTCDWWFKVNCAMSPLAYTKKAVPVLTSRRRHQTTIPKKYVLYSKNTKPTNQPDNGQFMKRMDSIEDMSASDDTEVYDIRKEKDDPILLRRRTTFNVLAHNNRSSRSDVGSHETQISRGKIRHRSNKEDSHADTEQPSDKTMKPNAKRSHNNILFIYRTKSKIPHREKSHTGKVQMNHFLGALSATPSPVDNNNPNKNKSTKKDNGFLRAIPLKVTKANVITSYATTSSVPAEQEKELIQMISTINYFVANNSNSDAIKFENHTRFSENQDGPVQAIPPGIFSNKTLAKYTSLFGMDLYEMSTNSVRNESVQQTDLDKRKVAQTFSNALSSYLENPTKFKKLLTQIRPTEPTDIAATTAEDETTYPEETATETTKDPLPNSTPIPIVTDRDDRNDEEILQRSQSQSFVKYTNQRQSTTSHLETNEIKSEQMADVTTTENPWKYISETAYLNPLSINDQLMTESNANAYLPKADNLNNNRTTDAATIEEFPPLNSKEVNEMLAKQSYNNGMEKTAKRIFGDLKQSDASHLMNVMKKAESNTNILKLILLLVQTCDQDNGKSRKSLLNTLIQMDNRNNRTERRSELVPVRTEKAGGVGSAALAVYAILPTIDPYFNSKDYFGTSTKSNVLKAVAVDSSETVDTKATPEKRESPVSGPSLSSTIYTTDKIADLRSLELLKSLYALASKYGRRR